MFKIRIFQVYSIISNNIKNLQYKLHFLLDFFILNNNIFHIIYEIIRNKKITTIFIKLYLNYLNNNYICKILFYHIT